MTTLSGNIIYLLGLSYKTLFSGFDKRNRKILWQFGSNAKNIFLSVTSELIYFIWVNLVYVKRTYTNFVSFISIPSLLLYC